MSVDVAMLDVERLTAWLDQRGLEAGKELKIQPLDAGRTNSMFRLERGDARWVLRRPAKVAVDRANEGMRREHTFLRALEGTPVPHPGVVGLCEDLTVLGCTFYVMQQVEGVHPIPAPASFDSDSGRAEVAFAVVDALAALHDADWRAAGLGELGNPDGFHERQVERWSTQLASYGGRELPGTAAVSAWLAVQPAPKFEPSIMHGDYHLLNVLVSAEPPARVTAILDWETATIGDPVLDLVGFCEIWCQAAVEGWPSRGQLIDRYRSARGLGPLGDLTYYEVLYAFRLSVLLEGIYQRSLRDPSRPDQVELGDMVLRTIAKAAELVAATRSPDAPT